MFAGGLGLVESLARGGGYDGDGGVDALVGLSALVAIPISKRKKQILVPNLAAARPKICREQSGPAQTDPEAGGAGVESKRRGEGGKTWERRTGVVLLEGISELQERSRAGVTVTQKAEHELLGYLGRFYEFDETQSPSQ